MLFVETISHAVSVSTNHFFSFVKISSTFIIFSPRLWILSFDLWNKFNIHSIQNLGLDSEYYNLFCEIKFNIHNIQSLEPALDSEYYNLFSEI